MKYYKIFRSRIAGELVQKGFKIKKTETNMKFPKLKVFLFADTPELRTALTEITENHKKSQEIKGE